MQKLSLKSKVREIVRIPMLFREWNHFSKTISSLDSDKIKSPIKFLIIPCDQRTVIGSRGDEAMLVGMITSIQRNSHSSKIDILTHSAFNHDVLTELNVGVVSGWANPSWNLKHILDICAQYDSVMLIGADTLDGHYSRLNSMRMWVVADLVSRMGKISTVLGFSFNEKPEPVIVKVINKLSSRVNVLLRDPVSFDRFIRCSKIRAESIADSAFQLQPSLPTNQMSRLLNWVADCKNSQQAILGFNVHPMLFDMSSDEARNNFISACVAAISKILDQHSISIILLSHDFRSKDEADLVLLNVLYEKLKVIYGERVFLDPTPYRATELKFIAGQVDMLCSARMHLSIAALGMKKPVSVFSYQGKFQGLFQLFDLPQSLIINPKSKHLENDLYSCLNQLVVNQDELTTKVANNYENVKKLSNKNVYYVLGGE